MAKYNKARQKSKYGTVEKVTARLVDALHELPDTWLMCRDVRHAWSVENDFHVTSQTPKTIQEIRRSLVCLRCGVLRNEVYIPTRFGGLEKTHSSYVYPQGYQIRGVPRGVKPQALVQSEQYRRTLSKVAESQRADRNGVKENNR